MTANAMQRQHRDQPSSEIGSADRRKRSCSRPILPCIRPRRRAATRVRFFSPALQAAVNARAALEEDLHQAIKAGQFLLYYQPQVEQGR